jgi:hypothetical protein
MATAGQRGPRTAISISLLRGRGCSRHCVAQPAVLPKAHAEPYARRRGADWNANHRNVCAAARKPCSQSQPALATLIQGDSLCARWIVRCRHGPSVNPARCLVKSACGWSAARQLFCLMSSLSSQPLDGVHLVTKCTLQQTLTPVAACVL